ncbi:MAG TPA: SDR family oxidoreductase [Vicinamibacterales bacterium]|nr:SDR family oxidoreductase [Vicinamibacterales bacterium]
MPKVVAITGASAGIGRACAERLARDGHTVVVSARRADRLTDVVRNIEPHGGRALAVVADVTSETDMRMLVERAVAAFGRLDVMICNAGIGFHGSLAETTPAIARRLFDVNVLGTIYAARAAYDAFARQGSGHIIAVSSIAGVRGGAGMAIYSSTKAAQIAFIESLRTEFLGTGLHASVVYPVTTPTEFRDVMQRDYGYASSGSGLNQSVEEVAAAMAHCVEHPRAEVYPKRGTSIFRVAAALTPRLMDRVMRKFDRRAKNAG